MLDSSQYKRYTGLNEGLAGGTCSDAYLLTDEGLAGGTCSIANHSQPGASQQLLCMQLPFFGTLTNWLQTQPELDAVVNADLIAVAGHSRGAKLAALTFASGKIYGQSLGFSCPEPHTPPFTLLF